MPKGHPFSHEELVMRKRERQRILYQIQKRQFAKDSRATQIAKREEFARSQGKTVIPWTVEQEMELLNAYRHTCSFCDQQSDELDLTEADPTSSFCIENMVPICQTCIVSKYTAAFPVQVVLYLPLTELPEGFNKERLEMICVHNQVRVYVIARLRKNEWQALIGFPEVILHIKEEYRYNYSYAQANMHTLQQVLLHGQILFESEARQLFPQYNAFPYRKLF